MTVFSLATGYGLRFNMSPTLADGSDFFPTDPSFSTTLVADNGSTAIFDIFPPFVWGDLLITSIGFNYQILGSDIFIEDIGYFSGDFLAFLIDDINLIGPIDPNSSFIFSEINTLDDLFLGAELNDVIYAGPGEDAVYGFQGDDSLSGDTGNDSLFGGIRNDVLRGGLGNDRLLGEAGADQLFGDAGNDLLGGGGGNDVLNGGAGKDRLDGDPGNDRLIGGSGNDRLFGDDGNDRLIGGSGRDQFIASSGRDVIVDFELGFDKIVAQGRPADFKNYDISQRNQDALVKFDTDGDGLIDSLTLVGVNADDLSKSDFIFV